MQAEHQALLQQGKATTEQALALHDALEPVDIDFMLGRWWDSGFLTDHRLDDL